MTFFQQLQRVETAHQALAEEPNIPTNQQCIREIHRFAEKTFGDMGTDPTIIYVNLILQLVGAMRDFTQKRASRPRLMPQEPATPEYVEVPLQERHHVHRRERDVLDIPRQQDRQQLVHQPIVRDIIHPRRDREVALQQAVNFTSLQPLAHSSFKLMSPSPSTPQHVWSGVSRPTYGQPEATPVITPGSSSETSLVSHELSNILNTFKQSEI